MGSSSSRFTFLWGLERCLAGLEQRSSRRGLVVWQGLGRGIADQKQNLAGIVQLFEEIWKWFKQVWTRVWSRSGPEFHTPTLRLNSRGNIQKLDHWKTNDSLQNHWYSLDICILLTPPTSNLQNLKRWVSKLFHIGQARNIGHPCIHSPTFWQARTWSTTHQAAAHDK
jgi:hypothetical protein